MLKINIEGDEPTVYAVLAILGAHAAASLSGVIAPAPAPAPSEPAPSGSSDWTKGNGVNTDAVIKGRELAQGLVKDWVVGWDLPSDQQPNRAELLPELSRSGRNMRALVAYLDSIKDPWVAAGASPEQASHIAQVGSALQLFPSPDPVIPLD
jgi:hypothetical protein